MQTKQKFAVVGLLLGALVFTSACGIVDTLMGMTSSSGTVAELWDDVPEMEGMTEEDIEMPTAARLMIRTMTQGRMNFISYSTDRTPQEVQDYYTTERMSQAGWNTDDAPGCVADTQTAEVGAVCFFARGDQSNEEMLAVVAAVDEDLGRTAVFFVRIDASESESESGN